jgi:ABC-type Mn2+/Zn2+ transport system ATPase subunit
VRTAGLMAELFMTCRRQGHTILVASHDLGQMRDLCDRVVLLNRRLLAYGATAEVLSAENLELAFGGPAPG